VIILLWWFVGYSIAFAPGREFFGSLDWMMFNGVGGQANTDYGATIPHVLFAFYQCMFAIITPALITGTFADGLRPAAEGEAAGMDVTDHGEKTYVC
jgi:Amt family ammonium transporter